MNDRLYTVKEAAEYLRVSAHTVSRLIREGKLDSYKFGNRVQDSRRISTAHIREYLEIHGAGLSDDEIAHLGDEDDEV